jgi:hypothetical protein
LCRPLGLCSRKPPLSRALCVPPEGLDWLAEASHFSANGGAHMANERRSLDVHLWLLIGWRSVRSASRKTSVLHPGCESPCWDCAGGIGGPRQPLCYVGTVPAEISTACHGGYCSYYQCHHDHVHGGLFISRFADRSSRWDRNDYCEEKNRGSRWDRNDYCVENKFKTMRWVV